MSNALPSTTQIRAALAMLDWENGQLATAADVSLPTILNIKMGRHQQQARIMRKIARALESAGIEFTEMDGVRRRPQDIEVYIGVDRFQEFTEFVYQHLAQHGGDVCIHAGDETLFRKYRRDFEAHKKRMAELVESGRVTVRIIAAKSQFRSTWAQYRFQVDQGIAPTAFYAFGDCLALISFDHANAPYVVLHKSGPFAASFRASFEAAWAIAPLPPVESTP